MIALALLQAVVATGNRSDLATRKLPNAAWALDCCSGLLRSLKVARSIGKMAVRYDEVLGMLLRTMSAVLRSMHPISRSAHGDRRCVLAFLTVLSMSLSFLHPTSSIHLQQELARSVMLAFELLFGSSQSHNDWNAYFAPAACAVIVNPVLFEALSKDLQVFQGSQA